MTRLEKGGIDYIIGYHTQENRPNQIKGPIPCNRKDAWLGKGYYFWAEEEFAHYWGTDMKSKNNYYDIYQSEIENTNILNASFDEDSYFFFKNAIEKARVFFLKNGEDPDLQKVHRFLRDKFWLKLKINGIIFDDLPMNPNGKNRVYSDILPMYYKKRIQIAIFNKNIISNFAPFKIKEQ